MGRVDILIVLLTQLRQAVQEVFFLPCIHPFPFLFPSLELISHFLSTLVMQGATGMMPQAFPLSQTQLRQTEPGSGVKEQGSSHYSVGPDPAQLVALLSHVTDERLVQDVGCVYQFNIGEGGTWHLDLKNGRGSAGKGPPTWCPPDAVVSLSLEDLQVLFSGEITPFNAYMQGRVTIDGDVRLAMKLQHVVDRMKQPRMTTKTAHVRDDVMIV